MALSGPEATTRSNGIRGLKYTITDGWIFDVAEAAQSTVRDMVKESWLEEGPAQEAEQ